MRCGTAAVEITPKAGTHLAGSGMGDHRPAESVLDPLFARAIVFEADGRRACLLTLDVLAITEEYTSRIRAGAAERCGLEPDAVLVHSLQDHSAPSCGGLMLDPDFPLVWQPEEEYLTGAESWYGDYVVARAIEAMARAASSLQPVRLGVGSGVNASLAHNRRGIARDGSIIMPWFYTRQQKPLGPTEIKYLEGPNDPEVGVCCAQDERMRPVAALLHYSCHPVNLFATDYRVVSADWPGAWCTAVESAWGSPCTAAVLNGCCGNLNPWPPFEADFRPDHRRMGRELAEIADKVRRQVRFAASERLDWRLRRILLPYRDVPQARRVEVDRILTQDPQPKYREPGSKQVDPVWFLAASTRSIDYLRRRCCDGFPYEIQAFRIGDLAVVGLPGEPFVEGQLAIKLGSPAPFTFVAHMTSHYVGYIPTAAACARGGHEANRDCTYWAKLAPEALDIVVANAVSLVKEMF